MANKDTISKTLIVALTLCIVCSLVVSGAAVLLKDMQEANKSLDMKRNVLAAAGLLQEDVSVEKQFEQVLTKVVDLQTGKFTDAVDVAGFDQRKSSKVPSQSIALNSEQDQAKISRRENYALVYLIEKQGQLATVIVPIHGYGLWSTLYGFVALESDVNTIVGLGFYEHGETPGLGGEVDNPNWKKKWIGKKVYRDGEVAIKLIKGTVDPRSNSADFQVDGLAGATLTSRGVSNLVQFWLGKMGFQPFLNNLRSGEAG
ncbi:MAG: Na(+)-translocating NADH-quinone reductase subunit C [Spongiibacteraceae bacterium]|nr:Na(+)-translocating NADH-quinone reductase subunit C [Spongiibacteraceae bacterium]